MKNHALIMCGAAPTDTLDLMNLYSYEKFTNSSSFDIYVHPIFSPVISWDRKIITYSFQFS